MTPASLVKQVKAAGGRIHICGAKVRVTAPRALPYALMETLRAHRDDLMAYLGGDPALALHEAHVERAAPQAEAKPSIQAYEYRLADNGDTGTWHILLAPCDLAEAERSLRDRFGAGRVLAVRERRHGS